MIWWKVGRELKRLQEQFRGIGDLITGPWRRRQYDRCRGKNVTIFEGEQPLTAKVAILLLYQPAALPASILITCRHLRQRGYAVLAVANGGLSDDARQAILTDVWRLAKRPNFGYDFGGYREGIQLLTDWQVCAEHLLILNDSIWFPLSASEDLLLRLEANEAGVSGPLLHTDAESADIFPPETAVIAESYLLHVPGDILASEAFSNYWCRLKITDVKSRTIRRGERGFSQAMIQAGIAVTGISWREEFLRCLAMQSNVFLEKTLQYAAYTEPHLKERGDELCDVNPKDAAWRKAVLEHVHDTLRRRRFNGSFIWATERLFGLSFLKKLKQPLFSRMRNAFLEAIANGDLPPPDPEILKEIRDLQSRYQG